MVVDLARRLPKQGFVPRIIALGGGGPLEEEIRASGIELMIGPATNDRRATKRFSDHALAGLSADTIVHTHLGADHWFGVPAQRRGFRWVSTCHNDDRQDPWWKRRIKTWAWNRADRVAAVSVVAKDFWQSHGARIDHWKVIPNGVELSRFTPKTHLSYSDIPLMVSVGRLVEQKRQAWLLRALAPIQQPWRLELLGDGPLRGSLEALADELGIRPRVSFRGVLPDVRQALSRADLFVFPSAWEGQGIAVLEAAASGVPLVLSDLPVFHEWLSDRSALFVPESIEAWTQALEQALHDARGMQTMGWHAYEDVCRVGSIDHMVQRYSELYSSLR